MARLPHLWSALKLPAGGSRIAVRGRRPGFWSLPEDVPLLSGISRLRR